MFCKDHRTEAADAFKAVVVGDQLLAVAISSYPLGLTLAPDSRVLKALISKPAALSDKPSYRYRLMGYQRGSLCQDEIPALAWAARTAL